MYHWFFLLKITVVKIMNNLNVCSAHSYLYPRSRFKYFGLITPKNLNYLDLQNFDRHTWWGLFLRNLPYTLN
jgi:hypothetical protein